MDHAAVENIRDEIENLTLASPNPDQGQVTAMQKATKAIVESSSGAITCIIRKEDIPEYLQETLPGTEVDVNAVQSNDEGTYTSPQKLVFILVREDEWVKSLWANQKKLHWSTFSFYQFCKKFVLELTYELRKEHVMGRLWREKEKLKEISKWDYRQFCPPVYVKSGTTWRKWNWNDHRRKLVRAENVENIEWITNNVLKKYLTNNSDENADPNKKGHLYWAVFEEDDFENDNPHGDGFPGRTQVYVGQSKNGITERWLGKGNTHCRKMLNACKCVCNMDSCDPTSSRYQDLQKFQLVHLRLLLHKAKACHQDGSTSGLFIMYTSTNKRRRENAEKRNRDGKRIGNSKAPIFFPAWNPKDMKYGLNKI